MFNRDLVVPVTDALGGCGFEKTRTVGCQALKKSARRDNKDESGVSMEGEGGVS